MKWINVNTKLPKVNEGFCEEVLVWVDGHRGPSFSNSYAVVAYLGHSGKWFTYDRNEELVGVVAWTPIKKPRLTFSKSR